MQRSTRHDAGRFNGGRAGHEARGRHFHSDNEQQGTMAPSAPSAPSAHREWNLSAQEEEYNNNKQQKAVYSHTRHTSTYMYIHECTEGS